MTDTTEEGTKAKAEVFIKATLNSGKTIHFREYMINDQEQAIIAGGAKGGDKNATHQAYVMQEELLKNLIVAIDGKRLSGAEKETFKKSLTPEEYIQIMKAMEDLVPNPTKPKLETVSSFGRK